MVYEHWLRFLNPFSGRFLLAAFRTAGLADIVTEVFTFPLSFDVAEFLLGSSVETAASAGRISPSEARRWSVELSVAKDYGIFFAHVATCVANRMQE